MLLPPEDKTTIPPYDKVIIINYKLGIGLTSLSSTASGRIVSVTEVAMVVSVNPMFFVSLVMFSRRSPSSRDVFNCQKKDIGEKRNNCMCTHERNRGNGRQLTTASRHILLAVILKLHGASLGSIHRAPVSKLPPQVRLAMSTDELRLNSQGQSRTTVSPRRVTGQEILKSRLLSSPSALRVVFSAGQRSGRGSKDTDY